MPPPAPAPLRSRSILIALMILVVLAVALAVIGLVVAQRPAHAGSQPGTGHASASSRPGTGHASAGVVHGGTCTTPDVVARHGTQQYRCWQKHGETCPHWHWVYNPDVPKSTRTAWPAAPCTTCTPATTPPMTTPPATTPPAATSSPTPTPAGVPHPADTTPPPAVAVPVATQPPNAGGTLPVTGAPAGATALAGLLLTLAGVGLRFRPRRC